MNVTVFVVRVWGVEYREELILNFTVFFVMVWVRAIYSGTDIECYYVCCEGLAEGNKVSY